ncbi:hypothetical protein C8R47DRAFT_1064358 [Mycena vitilis]|nr:hypothetical protein C8R47DRAFT_1064358 [Mycena vitilis]
MTLSRPPFAAPPFVPPSGSSPSVYTPRTLVHPIRAYYRSWTTTNRDQSRRNVEEEEKRGAEGEKEDAEMVHNRASATGIRATTGGALPHALSSSVQARTHARTPNLHLSPLPAEEESRLVSHLRPRLQYAWEALARIHIRGGIARKLQLRLLPTRARPYASLHRARVPASASACGARHAGRRADSDARSRTRKLQPHRLPIPTPATHSTGPALGIGIGTPSCGARREGGQLLPSPDDHEFHLPSLAPCVEEGSVARVHTLSRARQVQPHRLPVTTPVRILMLPPAQPTRQRVLTPHPHPASLPVSASSSFPVPFSASPASETHPQDSVVVSGGKDDERIPRSARAHGSSVAGDRQLDRLPRMSGARRGQSLHGYRGWAAAQRLGVGGMGRL